MNIYDIFKSEGGWRVCLTLWGDNPVIDQCPWFATEDDALACAKMEKFNAKTRDCGIFDLDGYWVVSKPGKYDTVYINHTDLKGAVDDVISYILSLGYEKQYIFEMRKDLKDMAKQSETK